MAKDPLVAAVENMRLEQYKERVERQAEERRQTPEHKEWARRIAVIRGKNT